MPVIDAAWPRADAWLAMEAEEPDLVVVGVPSSKASLTPSNADLAPLEMRSRLDRYSTFHGEYLVDFNGLPVRDLGNWPVSQLDMNAMPDMVRRLAADLPESALTVFLGGDNAITRPLATSLGDLDHLGVITFDTHHDVRSLDNGPTNGTPIRGMVDEDGLPGENVVQIGIHSFANSAPYRAYCDERGIGIITVADIEERGMGRVVDDALTRLGHCDRVYVDIDVDVLDRAFAPGCPGARPGGLTVRQLAAGVFGCALDPRVVAMDIVEVDPGSDVGHVTVDAMAHLFLTATAGLSARD